MYKIMLAEDKPDCEVLKGTADGGVEKAWTGRRNL